MASANPIIEVFLSRQNGNNVIVALRMDSIDLTCLHMQMPTDSFVQLLRNGVLHHHGVHFRLHNVALQSRIDLLMRLVNSAEAGNAIQVLLNQQMVAMVNNNANQAHQ